MVKTTDGTERVFKAGDVLFQDDTENCPSDKPPQHYSGGALRGHGMVY